MKITKDVNGKLIIDGEHNTFVFPEYGEMGLDFRGLGDDVGGIHNFTVIYPKEKGRNLNHTMYEYLIKRKH